MPCRALAQGHAMKITGILVADQAKARLFTIAHPRDPFKEVAELTNNMGRLHDRDMASDRPGRAFDTTGTGRHAMGKHNSPTTQQDIRFADLIGEALADHRRQGSFQRLVVCAPPKLLGFIREALPEHVVDCLIMTLNKDFGPLKEADIRAHLMKELPALIQPISPPAA